MFSQIFAERMKHLGTETAFEVLAKAKALERTGKDIIHLEIGEPDFDTPGNIIESAVTALRDGYTHYTPTPGIHELRGAIAEYVARTRGIPVEPEEVVVTPGGKPIMFFSILTLVDPGDEVLLPDPGFPIYESMVRFVGGIPVPIPLLEENDFALDVDRLRARIGPKTKMIILNSPQNPTGGVLSKTQLEEIAHLVQGKNIIVLSDEIYHRIVYEGEAASIASLPGMKEQTIILDGFSKTYAMTGWRLGYGVMHPEIAERITRLMVNSNSCTAAFTQVAGIEALTGPQDAPRDMVEQFRTRRDVIVEGLNSIPGITCRKPRGAFYVFPNISALGVKCELLADYLLREASVAVLAGTSFGRYGEGYLRLSYANSVENIEKAVDRIAQALQRLEKHMAS